MKEHIIDCRGLACPAPVLRAKETIDRGAGGLSGDAGGQRGGPGKCQPVFEPGRVCGAAGGLGRRRGSGGGAPGRDRACRARPEQPVAPMQTAAVPKIMVLAGTDRLGTGDDFLGERLMVNFLGTLKEMGRDLWTLVLLNAGVKLACTGSEVLTVLSELEAAGVQVLVCGTCLNHFKLLAQKQVGETTNMLDIVSHMQLADKVVSVT